MTTPASSPRPRRRIGVLLAATLLAACAGPQVDAQWSNPAYQGTSLRGQKVLVACQARELAVQAVCEEQLARELAARGAQPLQFTAVSATGDAPTDDAIAALAHRSGAAYSWRAALTSSVPTVSTGPTIGIGIGGGGYRGGMAGGISVPIGGTRLSEAYAADHALREVRSAQVVWSARTSAPASDEVARQLSELARVAVDALHGSGLI